MGGKLGVLAAVAAVVAGTGGSAGAAPAEGTVYGPAGEASGYVVLLKDSAAAPRAESTQDLVSALTRRYGGTVHEQYTSALHGFAIGGLDETRARQLAAAPEVARVERNVLVRARRAAPPPRAEATQSYPPWNLDRIDNHPGNIDGTYEYPDTAQDITAYVLDTGMRITHQDFGGRASYGRNFVNRVINYYPNPANDNNSNDPDNSDDCDGYGTHVAGTIGGTDWGVAKQIKLVAVRVLDCSGNGFVSEIVAGIDWVTAHAQHPAVVNLDTTGDPTILIDAAVRRSIGSGLTWVVPAGDGYDEDSAPEACAATPSDIREAIVVSSSSQDDDPVYYAGYGPCVDLYAPGIDIPGPWIGSDTALQSRGGTSLAAPHVAGAAALILQAHPDYSPARIRDALVQGSTVGKLRWSAVRPIVGQSTPNRLLFVRQADPPRPVGRTRSLYNPRFGTTEVYARSNAADHLIYAYWSGDWSDWTDLGGTLAGDPAVLYNPRFGTTEVYARMADNHLAYRYYSAGWSPWIDLGGDLAGDPAVLYNPKYGTTEVYVRTSANTLAYVYYSGGWSGWNDLGGALTGDPGLLYNPKYGTTEAYATTAGGLAYRYYLGGWSDWTGLGGSGQGTPSVLYNPTYGTTEVYLRTTGDQLAYVYYLGGWSGWNTLGGALDQPPGVVYNPTHGTTEVYVHTPDNTLQYVYYLGGWSGWNDLGGATAGSPSVLYNPRFGTTEAYTLAQDGHAYYKYYAAGWGDYIDISP
ncbi:S8 family serine peptidase [Dactylosporangium sp. CA-092794]|uniref:S8 family serine peptidase n=1 Tax=Dactylosporangium sp. CA-092794 TaxID=3239929 RepID=UPI003D94F996